MTEISLPGSGHANQDAAGTIGRSAWVVDGATRADGADAGEYAGELSAALEAAAAHPDLTAADMIDVAVSRASNPAGHTATVAVVRGCSWAVLGDAAVVWDGGVLRDERLARVGADLREAWRKDPTSGALGALQECEGRWRNHQGGFWVAGGDRRPHGQHVSGRLPEGSAVLVCTDGALDVAPWTTLVELPEMGAALACSTLDTLRSDYLAAHGRVDDVSVAWV